MNIVAIIPARGGSKGIKDKNIVDVNGLPLIAYTILVAKQVKEINAIYVSTDSKEIANISLKYGAEVIERPKKLASDTSTDLECMQHALKVLKTQKPLVLDYILHLRATTPIRESSVLRKCLKQSLFLKKPLVKAHSLRSVEEIAESPYKYFKLDKTTGFCTPYMGNSIADTNRARQSHETAYKANGYIDILRPDVIESGSIHGELIVPFVTEPVIEIDTERELEYLRDYLKLHPMRFK